MKHSANYRRALALALTATAGCLMQSGALAQPVISAATKVTADKTKPGFAYRIFANSAEKNNSTAKSEAAIAGQLKDGDGNPLPNLADPTSQGAALAPSSSPDPENASIAFDIEGVINLNKVEGGAIGAFVDDLLFPGIPATDGSTEGFATEFVTFLDLPAGTITMGVTSDDGFQVRAGLLDDFFLGTSLGEFSGGRGAAETAFSFVIPEAGVYPFRMTYEQGGGDANVEWYTIATDGTKTLINDVANGGVKAYRSATVKAKDPYIASVSPVPGPRQQNKVAKSFSVVLHDGDTSAIDDATIDLKIDGKAVTSKVRDGKTVTLTYNFDGLQFPSENHTASLTFKGAGGFSRTESWSFRNIKNVILPNPVVTENFDSYAEGTQPTGWVATNFTVECNPGEDIADQKSDTYKNWVVISTDTIPLIDDNGINEVNPNESVNGVPLTIDKLRSGNVLYAESDSRCNGSRASVIADGAGSFGQTQFIVTKPYDLSKVANPVLSFAAGYEQNQDSFGGVEYSVDGGNNWLPVVYYIDVPLVKVKADGTTDGVATLTTVYGDTSVWVDDKGVVKGERYGDALAAPINDSIGDYIAPRVNDDFTEGKRIEIFRLPAAASKSDVRLRLAATGSDSWYFFIDNIAFYDVAPVAPAEPISNFKATLSGSNVVLTWAGGAGPFAVQSQAALGGAWTETTTATRTVTVPASGSAQFFRIQDKGAN